ncbi:MAG: aminomethyl-transferring glycine dehydrogenase subunit GcvPA [Deltaproteobacteria bacterium]|nr:aminomethyl-transferring glycine dehydrogenase subunit GcvPA [Deltaproteobacteria bacterium]
MKYLPQTEGDIAALCAAVGVGSPDALFSELTKQFPIRRAIDLPNGKTERAVRAELQGLADANRRGLSFIGAGAYAHYSPVAIDHLLLRSEFLTAYTPYQAEISQGTLQAIFEFQTMIANVFGTDIANASMYDGATATAEAMLMARRVTSRERFVVARTVHPEYREVARTYLTAQNADAIVEVGFTDDGGVNFGAVAAALSDDVAALVVQQPNFFGRVEDVARAAEMAHARGALLVVAVAEPHAFGLYEAPGALAADIVAGEGQSFGMAPSFGGPSLGLFGCKEAFVRKMPGRLVGQTVDSRGARGFVLTLSTREQHIRREKATSNICTNQGLVALAATIYLSLVGESGFRELAHENYSRASAARDRITKLPGWRLRFAGPIFNEFAVDAPVPAARVVDALSAKGVLPGFALSRFYPDLPNTLLVNVTELHEPSDIDRLVSLLSEVK